MSWGRLSQLSLIGIIGVAVIGYFVGLSDGVPQPDGVGESSLVVDVDPSEVEANPKLAKRKNASGTS